LDIRRTRRLKDGRCECMRMVCLICSILGTYNAIAIGFELDFEGLGNAEMRKDTKYK
jgi:hypothetical protein